MQKKKKEEEAKILVVMKTASWHDDFTGAF